MFLSLSLSRSLLYLFIFTLISAALVYRIVVKAYSGVYDLDVQLGDVK